MKDRSFQVNMRLVSVILMAAGLVATLFLFISMDATAETLAPPQVLAVFPPLESHDAEVTTPISITYDQDMNPATLSPQSFVVHARQTGWLTETLSVDGGMIKLQPSKSLHAGELVQVSATTDTLSLDGEASLEPTVWEFTTKTWGGNAYFHHTQSLADDANTYAALGDIDGDGDLDAVNASCYGLTNIYQNDGSGTFTVIQSFDYSYGCFTAAVLGDLDSDGDLDAILTGTTMYEANIILLNDGTGHFTESAYPIASHGDYDGELGDLDGDGDLDLFVTSYGLDTGAIRIWMNDGTGIFSLTQTIDTAYELSNVALGDLDGDGDLDAFVAGWYNGFNVVWLNDGTGNFSEAQSIPNANTYTIQLGDLDGDGDLDAYMANATYDMNDLPDEVWLNDGTGHFINSGQSLHTPLTAIPGLGDLDADGDLDLYLSDYWNFAPDQVWVNDGSGNFSFRHSMNDNLDGGLVFLGDLDGDGNLDAFTGNNYSDFYIFLNGDWTQATPIPHTSVGHSFAQCPEDLNSFYLISGDTLRYDVDTGKWNPLAPPPDGWWLASAVCYQGKIYLAGGEYYGGQSAFSIYDIANDSWARGPSLTRPVTGAALAAWDGKIFLIGGSSTFGGIPINQVDVFDIATNIWTTDALPHMPVATTFPGFAQAGPYIYLVGGFSGDFNHNINATQRLDLANEQWELGPEFISARAYPATAVTEHHLYTTGGDEDGGSEGNTSDKVELLDLTNWPNGSWQDLDDPLPKPSQANFNYACTEALTGGEIWSIGGTNRTVVPLEDFNTNLYYPTGEPCIGNTFALALAPDNQSGEGYPGNLVTYSLSLTNTGDLSDAYDAVVSSVWPTTISDLPTLWPGETTTLMVTVTVPLDVQLGDVDTSVITLTSQGDELVSGAVQVSTSAIGEFDFDLQPIPPDSQQGHPGDVLTFTLQVSNIGDFEDNYNVAISATWETTASLAIVGPVLPGDDDEFFVMVTIPQEAMHGDWDFALVTLTSQANPLVNHAAKLTSIAIWHRMLMPLAFKD